MRRIFLVWDIKTFQMLNLNLTPFTAMIDDPACLKHMVIEDPLQTVYDGKNENLRLHIQDFTCQIQNTGL